MNNDKINTNEHPDENNFNYDSYYMRQQPLPPFSPPFGAPIRPPFGPPFEPPFGLPPGQQRPPIGRPPSFIPQGQPSIFAVDPGAIRPCQFRFVYIWLRGGREFWAFLVFVGPRSVAGFRWTGFNWVYFGTDLRNIVDFECF